MMHSFPGVAVTNYLRVGGLKQQKCIRSHFRKAEVQNQGAGRGASLWAPREGCLVPLSEFLIVASHL